MSDNMFNKDSRKGGLGGGIVSPNAYQALQQSPPIAGVNPAIANANSMLQFMGALMQTIPQLQQMQQPHIPTSLNPVPVLEPEPEPEVEISILGSEETMKEFREMQEALKNNEKVRLDYLDTKKEKNNHLEGTTTAIDGNTLHSYGGMYEVNEEEPFPSEINHLLVPDHTKITGEDLNKAKLQNKLHQLEVEANKVREKLQELYFEEWKAPLFDGLKQVLNSSVNSVMLVYPSSDGAIVDVLEFTSESEGVKQYTSETMSVFVTEK